MKVSCFPSKARWVQLAVLILAFQKVIVGLPSHAVTVSGGSKASAGHKMVLLGTAFRENLKDIDHHYDIQTLPKVVSDIFRGRLEHEAETFSGYVFVRMKNHPVLGETWQDP